MKCQRHPWSPIGIGRTNKDQCWQCRGCPPDWVCSECGKKFPCAHTHESVGDRAMIEMEAEARRHLDEVFERIALHGPPVGLAEWAAFDRAVNTYKRAVREGMRCLYEHRRAN